MTKRRLVAAPGHGGGVEKDRQDAQRKPLTFRESDEIQWVPNRSSSPSTSKPAEPKQGIGS